METSKNQKDEFLKVFSPVTLNKKNQSDLNTVEQLFNYSINIIKEFFILSTVE